MLYTLLRVLLCYLQIATVEVPEVHMGSVVELLGKRRGQMFDMQGVGWVKLSFTFFFFSIFCNFVPKRWKILMKRGIKWQ